MKEIVGGMSMDYMTLKEASEKWGVSSRQVNYYCVEGRIPGAVKTVSYTHLRAHETR